MTKLFIFLESFNFWGLRPKRAYQGSPLNHAGTQLQPRSFSASATTGFNADVISRLLVALHSTEFKVFLWDIKTTSCKIFWLQKLLWDSSPYSHLASMLNQHSLPLLNHRAIRSIAAILSLLRFFFLSFCTVTDFSAGALPSGVKFCVEVRPHLRQVFSHFGEDSLSDGRILGVNRAPYGWICFLLKHLSQLRLKQQMCLFLWADNVAIAKLCGVWHT